MAEQLKISNGASDKKGITFYIKGICYGIRASIGKYGEIKTYKMVITKNNPIILILLALGIYREVICFFNITNWLYHIPTFIFAAWLFWGVGYVFFEKEIGKYHGAEHKVANCWRKHGVLDIDLVRKCSRIHNNCGTNIMVEIVVFQIISSICMNQFAIHIPEIITVVAPLWLYNRFPFNLFGILIQYITTTEPDEKHLQVGICALEEVLESAEKELEIIKQQNEE